MGLNLYVTLPSGKSFFATVFSSWVLAVHAIVALALLGAAISAVIRAVRARRAVAFTSAGLIPVHVNFNDYVDTTFNNTASATS